MTNFKSLVRLVALAALLFPTALWAGSEDDVAALDVIDGWSTDDGGQMIALRIRLAPGWKTYWRAPGDAGIPPQFSWVGADNLRAVRVFWPRPHVFDQNGFHSIGYDTELVLPIELLPLIAGDPIQITGQIAMGVCKDICIPTTLDISEMTAMPGDGPGADSAIIRAALSAQPKSATSAGAGPVACTLTPIDDGLRLKVSIPVPDQGGLEVVVLEPARSDVWVSQAEISRSGRHLTATADLVPPEARPFAFDRSQLRVTVIGRDGAVDMRGCRAS